MSGSHRERTSSISLDQLLALNDEIAALVRAGVPLEKGLTQLGHSASGKLGLIATRLADRMSSGESLADILEKDTTTFPPVWRSVVLAGIRSEHLATALESLSRTGRRATELRRSMTLALVYPGVVVTLAYLLFLFSIVYLLPTIAGAYKDLSGVAAPMLAFVPVLEKTLPIWGIAIPVIVVGGVVGWWFRSGRAMRSFHGQVATSRGRLLFGRHRRGRFPSVRQSLFDGRIATFAEVLGMLDEHNVPMHEAIVLAADASGDHGLSHAARSIAQRLEKGETIERREDLPTAFPPLLGWSIISGMGRSGLQRALAASAEMYRQRAISAVRWAAVYMPIVLTVVIGGGAVMTQAMVVFLPFINLLYRLAAP